MEILKNNLAQWPVIELCWVGERVAANPSWNSLNCVNGFASATWFNNHPLTDQLQNGSEKHINIYQAHIQYHFNLYNSKHLRSSPPTHHHHHHHHPRHEESSTTWRIISSTSSFDFNHFPPEFPPFLSPRSLAEVPGGALEVGHVGTFLQARGDAVRAVLLLEKSPGRWQKW